MFNERLRFFRESAGMTQTELAKKISVAPTTYRNYENTSREPNYETLIKIASVLGITTDELLGVPNQNIQSPRIKLAISQLPQQALSSLYDYVDFLIYKYRNQLK